MPGYLLHTSRGVRIEAFDAVSPEAVYRYVADVCNHDDFTNGSAFQKIADYAPLRGSLTAEDVEHIIWNSQYYVFHLEDVALHIIRDVPTGSHRALHYSIPRAIES